MNALCSSSIRRTNFAAAARPVLRQPCGCRHQTTKGYQSLGSFHSENLKDIMAHSDEEYQAPELPFAAAPPTGDDFMMDRQNWTFLNHGAFGGALRCGYRRAEQWRWHLEQQPLRYFDRDLLPHLAYSTRRLAQFCSRHNATSKETREGLTLVQNATAGLNGVLKGFHKEYGKGARVVLWDTSYGSIKKLAAHTVGPSNVMEIPLQGQYLFETDDPTQVFQQALDDTLAKCSSDGHHYLLVLDHTTSNTAINMPIQELAEQAKQTLGDDNCKVVVDGAHGLLAQEVLLEKLADHSIDFYVANGHKWLSCPRGVGMLYCGREELRDSILAEPAIISHGVDEPDLLSRFVWDGCRDYAAALALPVVLEYWQAKNPEAVRATMRQTLLQGIQRLADHWHDGCPQNDWFERGVLLVPPTHLISPLACVALPAPLCGPNKTSNDAKQIQDFLYDHRIEVPIKCLNGKLFVRVSCHIYNTVDEFDRLGQVLLTYPRQ